MKKRGVTKDPNYWQKYRRKWHDQAAKKMLHCVRCDTDKLACYVHRDKETGELVCRSCRKKVHPGLPRTKKPRKKRSRKKVRAIQRKYINQNRDVPDIHRNHRQEWTMRDDARIVDPNRPSDPELEIELGRTINSIHDRRYLLNKRKDEAEKATESAA